MLAARRRGRSAARGLARWLVAAQALAGAIGCDSEPSKPPPQPGAPTRPPHTAESHAPKAVQAPSRAAPEPPADRLEPPESVASGPSPWIIDELVDVAPAGPAAASQAGVVVINRRDELLLAALGSFSDKPSPTESPVAMLKQRPAEFAPLARGPAIAAEHAYWVSKGRLVRRKIPGGPLEVLTSDARDFTRVAAPSPYQRAAPTAVAYIARRRGRHDDLYARLWVEGHGALALSTSGASASSVALAQASTGWLALALEGRTGMSPLHARHVQLTQGSPRLGDDRVAWVAGSAQPLTEIRATGSEGGAWGMLAIERDVVHFGLARLDLSNLTQREATVTWRDYPNGLDPAPLAVGSLCGCPAVAYARPAEARPHSPQELHLASLGDAGLSGSQRISSASGYSDVSLIGVAGGGLLVYVADRRTWSLTVRCASAEP